MTLRNKLDLESSPYLQQHADNPVHWLAWNEESLRIAQDSDKPILLSVGYSACHWCHVMAHESFEDIETAQVMNELFINIKVDKEERPDLDKIYQNAHSLLTERPGGWPLTVFLTPDTRMPIFAGTYFPKKPRHGLPAFTDLLRHIHEIWQTRKDDIQQQSQAIRATYSRIYESSKPEAAALNRSVSDIARNQIEKQFDPTDGGFSDAPKFPHPSILDFILKYTHQIQHSGRKDPRILHTALFTLDRMAEGGMFDHIGGGFCRYSTDRQWMIPHFEKMLYDNGPLLTLYSQAWKLSADPVYKYATEETAGWVIREMQSAEGGYFSAQDADSEGEEGKFFTWSQREIQQVLEAAKQEHQFDTATIEDFKRRFGLSTTANFEGRWHFHGYTSELQISNDRNISLDERHQQFSLLRQAFFDTRERRVHPATDTKILTAWNGLMIHGMASSGRLLCDENCIDSASAAAYYIKEINWHNNRLAACAKDGTASLNAYLDDYAFMLYGLLELLQSRWDNTLYEWCLQLADALLRDFEDTRYGGFFFTDHQHETLIQRLKTFSDDAIPSGNAIASLALNRLGYLAGRPHYIEAAEKCLKSAWTSIAHAPVSHCAMLNTLDEYLTPPDTLIVRTHAEDHSRWLAAIRQFYLPSTMVYLIPAETTSLHDSLSSKVAGEQTLAYLCQGMTCQPAVDSLETLQEQLRNNSYRIQE